ncbi:MAG TPA: hypothetical protein VGO09_08580, partial [Flavisolibacter sp.]|nr:hypothetical protein [Flavisolibacter sp.]
MIAFSLVSRNKLSKRSFAFFNTIIIVAGLFILFNSCSNTVTEKKYRIGFAQCTGTANWKKATLEGMQRELSFHPGTELIYRSANDNSDLQVKQIKELLGQNIDILLVSPNEAQPLTSVVEEAYNKG